MRDWRQYTLDTLRDLNLRAKKSRGQNFLIRYRVVKQMVESAEILPTDHVLEIGGGLGILTDALVNTGAKVTVIEKEKKLATFLDNTYASNDRVSIIHDDALLAEFPADVRVVSNLPYSISTPIVDKILHHSIKDATIMLQKEVGLRCLANPGSDHYSRLSVLCDIHSTAKRVLDITPNAFFPQPQVSSVVISLWKKEPKFDNDHEELELLTRNLFSLKRRIVRSVIRGFLKRKDVSEDAWEKCPYKSMRIFNISIAKIDEILTHLKEYNAWPLA